ncbi:MAG: DUF1365 domain-containing protein [Cytophagales bacterium]|nr:DUF1365 domain-containing protein [Cytophagales bacterium]
MSAPLQPLLARGSTWHCRTEPARNAFKYDVYFLILPMRAMRLQQAQNKTSPLSRNKWSWLSFYDADHGTRGSDALAWVESLLATAAIDHLDGEIWLQTFPRVLGYVFKPISIWYLVRSDESLAAVVVEVNNTFGQRHVYVLSGQGVAWNKVLQLDKAFHVSPFFHVSGSYQFRFTKSDGAIAAYITHGTLQTHWIGKTAPLTKPRAMRAFLSSPLMTFGIVARIHWQAVRLWWKKTPFYSLPEAPAQWITHAQFST